MRKMPVVSASVCLLLVCCASTLAGLVAPGGSITFGFGTPLTPPTGDVVASDSRTLTLGYVAPDGFALQEPQQAQVTFSSQVLRDPSNGHLTFFYDLEQVGEGGISDEGSLSTFRSFGSFQTDVTGEGKNGSLTVSRSSDGAELSADGGGQGLGRVPTFAVATDATHFNAGGTMTLRIVDEFILQDLSSPERFIQGTAAASLTVEGIFQPSEGATAIPLPAGVWPGFITLAAAGAWIHTRNRRAEASR